MFPDTKAFSDKRSPNKDNLQNFHIEQNLTDMNDVKYFP